MWLAGWRTPRGAGKRRGGSSEVRKTAWTRKPGGVDVVSELAPHHALSLADCRSPSWVSICRPWGMVTKRLQVTMRRSASLQTMADL